MLLIGPGKLITLWKELPFIGNGAVAVDNGEVIGIGPFEELRAKYPDAETADVNGGVIMPGLIDAHTHISRALAIGLNGIFDKNESFEQQEEIAAFESGLDPESCFASANAFFANEVRNGITTAIDMFTGCPDPRGILMLAAGAAGDVGVRAALCCGASAKHGKDRLRLFTDENLEFTDYCVNFPSELVKPMFGVDCLYSFTNEELTEIKRRLYDRAPFQISVSENSDDGFFCKRQYGCSPIKRLAELGFVDSGAMLAHCSSLSDEEAKLIAMSGAAVIHTPAADALRHDVTGGISAALDAGAVACLGSDGITCDMTNVARTAHAQLAKSNVGGAAEKAADMLLYGNARIASKLFGRELGVLKPGAAADVIAMDYSPTTPLNEENFRLHLLFGLSGSQCTFNMVNGRVLMRDRKLLTSNLDLCKKKTAAAVERLWMKYKSRNE